MIRELLLRVLVTVFREDQEPSAARKRVGSWMLRNVPGMLTCAEVESFLYDYVEGDLPPKQQQRFDMHLRLCPMCQVHFAAYTRAIELGQRIAKDDALPADMPEELVGAILLEIQDRDAT